VQQQLDLWHDPQKPHQALDIWEGLDQQERRTVIEALARLISKAVYPENPNNTQESKNEQ
jgi:hypothetical protein